LEREQRSLAGPAPHLLAALGELKDERAIAPVARFLTNERHVKSTAQALVALGPAVEEPVLKHLDHERHTVRVGVCDVLKEVGTEKSLPALRERLAKEKREMWAGYRDVVAAAQEAIERIEGRQKR